MANTVGQQPWAPDPDNNPGTPPVNGSGGERGTSVFDGNADWNADHSPVDPEDPAFGPATGVSYYEAMDPTPITTGVQTTTREVAGAAAKLTPTNVLTASSLTPAADASVTLTATLGSAAEYKVTGTVTFKEGATTLGTGTINASEVATYVHAGGFAAGAHTLTAVYGGDSHYATVTSAAIVVTAS